MANYSFKFLEEDEQFADIAKLFKQMEIDLVEEKYVQSVIMAGKAFELITLYLCDEENYPILKEHDQFRRIQELTGHIIPAELQRNFHLVRTFRNYAVHKDLNKPMETASRVHKLSFKVAVWLYDKYSSNDFVKPIYEGILYEKHDHYEDKIDALFEKKSNEFQKQVENTLNKFEDKLSETINKQEPKQVEQDEINSSIEINENDDFEGSYLLKELFKLSDSSLEAVEGINEFTKFKKYMHIERPIQIEFFNRLEEVVKDSSQSHLVMLCGSVGDGKSHLLSYLKESRSDLFEQFTVHQDATESFSTNKNAIDTLADVLSSFNNENFNKSTEKFILAINLGVLNNFLESNYAKTDYSKLKNIIEQSNIFNTNDITNNFVQDNVSIISFSDYNLFELNDSKTEPVASNHISSLFEKIIVKSKENPFYQAYLKDKENNIRSPIIFNYEMFSDENIREIIIHYLIKLFIKFKKIVSTRDLLNFIYEILVPASINEYDELFNYDYVDDLLPNLFFNNPERSDLLYLINKFDPIRIRNEEIDTFLINLNISENRQSIINEFLDFSNMNFDKAYFENFNEISFENKKELINTLIRFSVFYGRSDIKSSFKDQTYQNYLNYLYNYNKQDNKAYKQLFREVREAIFNWKGSLKDKSIEISELSSFKVSKKLNIKPKVMVFINESADDDDRFKTKITIAFTSNNVSKQITIDYSLYEYIIKLNQGYKPNKLEKENLTVFEEFINSFINEDTGSNDRLLIKSLVDNEDFYFEYENDLENFRFGRD